MPLLCILCVKAMKYFNTVLAYVIMTLIAKVVQIVSISLFGNVGACNMSTLYRVPVIVYLNF